LLAHGRWFSPGTLASSTTKTGRHDIAEILLKVALSTKIQIQIHTYRGNKNVTKCIHRRFKYQEVGMSLSGTIEKLTKRIYIANINKTYILHTSIT